MKKITTIFFLVLSITAFAQNSKNLEGYYNLSEHEMPARLYLLDDNTFYYSAIFGSVDLEIYGTYTIKDNTLHFHPQEDQMQTFILYGRENKSLNGTIAFNYYKPEDSYRKQVVFRVDKQWVKRPIEQANNDEIQFTIKKQQVSSLKIGYPAYHDKAGNFIQITELFTAKIPSGKNDFLLSYNRYADMRKQFSKNAIPLKGDTIVNKDKTRNRQALKEGEKEKIMTFLKENKMFAPTVESRGSIFQSIALRKEDRKYKLKKNAKGQLEEMLTYTKSGDKDINGSYYYDNKKLKEIITYKNEAKTGERKWYFENGQLEETGKYKNGLREGEWKTYYANGQLHLIYNHKDNLWQGESKSYFINGQIKYEGVYKNNKKEGEWKTYYKNGQLKEIENYKNGERAGICKDYYENGRLKKTSGYKGYTEIGNYEYYEEDGHLNSKGSFNEKGEKTGEWKFYHYESEKPSRVETYLNGKSIGEHKSFYDDGKLESIKVYTNKGADATHISYHKNGKIKEKEAIKNGEYTGERVSYYENGKLKSILLYNSNGKNTGESKEFYEDGQLKEIGQFDENGIRTGEWKYYFKNGKLSSSSVYKDGERNGVEKQFSESGQLLEIGNYKNGAANGEWKFYYETGQLKKVGTRTKFDDIGEWKFYYKNGQLSRVGTYNRSEERIGKWTDYYENGQLSGLEYHDNNGEKTGEWESYSEDGKLYKSATFKNNELIGEWKYHSKKYTTYYDNGKIKETGAKLDGDFFGELKHYFESGKLAGIHFYDNFGRAKGEWKHYHENGQVKTIRLWRFDELKELISCFDNKGMALDKGTFKDGNGTVNNYDVNGKVTIADYLYGKEINWDDSNRLNSLAWTVYENEDNKEKLEKAVKMVMHSIKLEKTYHNTDTYAALLYKTGNYKQALLVAKQAIEIAKKDKIDFKTTIQLIEKINNK